MPVPKRKRSKARRGQNRANKGLKAKAFASCAQCNEAIAPHQACKHCGFYKGAKVVSTKLDRNIKRFELKKARSASKPQEQESSQEQSEK